MLSVYQILFLSTTLYRANTNSKLPNFNWNKRWKVTHASKASEVQTGEGPKTSFLTKNKKKWIAWQPDSLEVHYVHTTEDKSLAQQQLPFNAKGNWQFTLLCEMGRKLRKAQLYANMLQQSSA